jgi:Concanavalin A-like lectin/glucanases superfamily
MSNIGLSTDLVLANTSVRPGTLVLPLSTQIPGRTITIKCATGSCAVSTCYISTSGGETFEDGSTRQALTTSYGFIKVSARAGKWYTGATTQPTSYTANTIKTDTTQATAISTATMNVSSLSLGSTNAFYTSSSLAYWGPYLLNSGFRTAQPQVFFLKPPLNVISSGLLARYRMNESSGSTVIDSVAGNNITIGGSPSRVSTSYGTYTGYALSIQNATQYGSITLPANMVVGAHSITSWVYFTGFSQGQSYWVGWGATCIGENHGFYGPTMAIFGGPSCIVGLNFLDNNTNTVSPQLNTWYFCVSTWDGNTTWKTYCYSPTTAYAFTYSYGMNAVISSSVFAIGCANGLYGQFGGSGYGGYIGEVRFYNRVLSASEVSQIYNGTG